MKKKRESKKQLVEVVVPFGRGFDDMAADGLFDDCPHCQELRRLMALGEVEVVEEDEPLSV
jgi:hypothetical protein